MYLYNYTRLKQRDKKIYQVAGTKVSSTGISLTWLKVVAPFTVFTTIMGFLISAFIGKGYMNPIGDDFSGGYTFFSIGSGLAIGLALWYIKVDSYRLYEYLIAYFKPKKTYHNLNTRNKEYILHTYKVDGLIKKYF